MEYIPAKTVISGYAENNNWFGNNYNMNIYKGCNHGCIYCDSRSECYHVENFDEVRVKENALALIYRDIKSKRKKGVIGTGAMSDPYNPFEKKLELTRGALEIINRFGFGVSIATKSDLVARDIDIFNNIRQHSPVLVKITVTSCDDQLAKKVEQNVVPPSRRFTAIKKLSENGIFAGILMMPVLPFIEDTEENISGIIRLAYENGAKFIYPAMGVTLRMNQREWYFSKLDELFPGMKKKYIEEFGDSYQCHSPRAKQLKALFKEQCNQYGLLYKMEDIIKAYKNGYYDRQLSLF
ncbi:MAG: repair photolyase [Eubacterium sp.]|jgi:DNA repair photolyase|nr:repair photolyase [Eubacterium sp.]